jgi:AcrR family transcriptional regulator
MADLDDRQRAGGEPDAEPDRRERILRAAAEVIGQRGICDTRISDVAERAGVSSGLAVYYFTSKDGLLAEALTYAENRFYDATMRELEVLPTARERIVRLIELSCPLLGDDNYPDWTLWVEIWSRALRDPAVESQRRELDRRWRSTIAAIVRDGRRQLEFAPIDVDDFTLRMAALMDGLVLQVILRDPETTSARMRDTILGMAARELGFEIPALDTASPQRATS